MRIKIKPRTARKVSQAEQIAMRVSRNTIAGNILLFALKFAAGVGGHSAAMISDALHSLSDVLSTLVVMIGIRLANEKADKEHPYGHERLECVAAILLAVILGATGIGVGYGGIRTIVIGRQEGFFVPGTIALWAAVISIVVKEAMYWYTRRAAKRINSGSMMADAWHHRSDALSSIGSLVGIWGARRGLPILDPLVCLLICLVIIKAAFTIFKDSINKMLDHSCDDETLEQIRELILCQDNVHGIDVLKTRLFGDKIYVDVEISMAGNPSLQDSHTAAHRVHDAIEDQFEFVKHCMVHVNPKQQSND